MNDVRYVHHDFVGEKRILKPAAAIRHMGAFQQIRQRQRTVMISIEHRTRLRALFRQSEQILILRCAVSGSNQRHRCAGWAIGTNGFVIAELISAHKVIGSGYNFPS